MGLSQSDVEWCYRTFLNRAPESDAVVCHWLEGCHDWHDLVLGLLSSEEFQGQAAIKATNPDTTPPLPVQYNNEVIISFSQNGEDILFDRAFKGKKGGSFIDIGAGHPIHENVTYWLRKKGWRGVNIEPNPIFYRDLVQYRPDDINLNCGVADKPGSLIFYQVEQNALGHGWGLSSFDPKAEISATRLGYKVNQLHIPVTTLNEIASEHAPSGIDILKIDVEGFETPIIKNTNWQEIQVKLICVESVEPNSANPAWEAWESSLLDAGYACFAFDGVNRYYGLADDLEMRTQLSAPVCCNDKYRKATSQDI